MKLEHYTSAAFKYFGSNVPPNRPVLTHSFSGDGVRVHGQTSLLAPIIPCVKEAIDIQVNILEIYDELVSR